MKIAVIPNLNKRDAEAYTARIVSLLRQCGAEVLMHASLAGDYGGTVACVSHEEMVARCDVVIAVGGDGTVKLLHGLVVAEVSCDTKDMFIRERMHHENLSTACF